jgi:hypothetical protein
MKVKFSVGMNIVKCNESEIVEVNDDSTDSQIDEMLNEWVFERVWCDWTKVSD